MGGLIVSPMMSIEVSFHSDTVSDLIDGAVSNAAMPVASRIAVFPAMDVFL